MPWKRTGPRRQAERACPSCGRTLPKRYELRREGAPVLVDRLYAGPGKVSQTACDDQEAAERAPGWWEAIRAQVRALADRFGLRLEPVEQFGARVDRFMGALDRSPMVRRAKLGKPQHGKPKRKVAYLESL